MRDNQFELKPQYINTLLKFHGFESEDAYFFIKKFEEVCLMMKISNLGVKAVKLHFVPFSLKNLAKKWLYSLEAGSISSWDNFIKVKKFYHIHKTVKLEKVSCNLSKQLMNFFGSTSNILRTSLPNALILR